MTNYRAIAVGINQYQHFQPLLYAQRDAQALCQFLVHEAGFSPDQCLLLTDTSPSTPRSDTYPNRNNIQTYITQVCQQELQAGDVLWCFFSGYGVQVDGKDYLMPIEGDSAQAATTGIAVETLLDWLQAAPTPHVFLVLDVNRSQSARMDERIGAQTIALANERGITTILACKPDQFSHETLALRQGLFTAALIEGMQYHGCVTAEQLAHYLSDRLPELSEHHWRPRQEPLAIIPPHQKYQLLFPGKPGAIANKLQRAVVPAYGNTQTLPPPVEQARQGDGLPPAAVLPSFERGGDRSEPGLPPAPTPITQNPQPVVTGPEPTLAEPTDPGDETFRRRLLLWGGLVALVLFALVLLRNFATFTTAPTSPVPTGTLPQPTPNPTTEGNNPGEPTSPDGTANPTDPSAPTSPTATNSGTTIAPVAPTPPEPSPTPPPTNPNAAGEAPALESARATLAAGQYERALQWLDQVPRNQRTDAYTQLRRQANQGILDQARTSLNRSRGASRTNQASDFSEAITRARRIRAGDPLYEEAQQDIARWSAVIMDLARARASQGSYESAIAAARLIPPDQPVYAEAQQSVSRWQQALTNQMILQRARSLIVPSQASSYNRAIATARGIPAGQPLYDEARSLINQWSQSILELAEARANSGRRSEAIQTAGLVPRDTPAYSAAQTAIARWRGQ